MSSLNNYVTSLITRDSVGVARADFGTALILSHTADWPGERVRSYGSIAEVAEDFDDDSPEYLAATALFSQNPHPTSVKVGKALNAPTQVYTGAIAEARDLTEYVISVAGVGFDAAEASYTSDAAATIPEICNGLVTALNAVTGNNYVATFAPLVVTDKTFTTTHAAETLTIAAHGLQTGDGPVQVSSTTTLPSGLTALTDYYVIKVDANTIQLATSRANALAGTPQALASDGTGTHTLSDTASTVSPYNGFVVTCDTAGDWFSLEVEDVTAISIGQTHTDPGLSADLTAILGADAEWYVLLTHFNSTAYCAAAMTWAEANDRVYVFDSSDSETVTTAAGNGDAIDLAASDNREASMGIYHPCPADFIAAAWMGRVLPKAAGSVTASAKTLSGITARTLTRTQRTNLIARNGNGYESVAGQSVTFFGTVGSGEFFDVVRDLAWLEDDIKSGVFEALVANDKIGFDDLGIAVIEARVRASLKRAKDRRIITETYTVTVPLAADVATIDKTARKLPDVKWSATLVGAIHKVMPITGVVSV